MGLRRSGDLLYRVEGGEHGLAVGVEVPVGMTLVGVAPRDREHLLALGERVLEQALARRQIRDVVLVDHLRDQQHRGLAHLVGLRVVLEELVHLGARHDGTGCGGEVLADGEARGVHGRGQYRAGPEVLEEVAQTLHEVQPTGVDGGFEDGGVGQREVRRRQRLDHVPSGEAQALLGAPVEVGLSDETVDGLSGRHVGLHQPVKGRVVLPRGVLEASVTLLRAHVRAARGDPGELPGQLHPAAGHPARVRQEREGRLRRGRAR